MTPYSIMIIDDDEVDRYTLKRLLKSCAANVPIQEAFDGEQALQFFKNGTANPSNLSEPWPPVIVFLDINMPRMGGFCFLEEFKKLREQQKNFESIVFMMITSSQNTQDKERASQYDFVKGYINKMPTTGDELYAKISQFIEG